MHICTVTDAVSPVAWDGCHDGQPTSRRGCLAMTPDDLIDYSYCQSP